IVAAPPAVVGSAPAVRLLGDVLAVRPRVPLLHVRDGTRGRLRADVEHQVPRRLVEALFVARRRIEEDGGIYLLQRDAESDRFEIRLDRRLRLLPTGVNRAAEDELQLNTVL